MRALQDLAAQYHVTITPEIDAPAHALAFTQFRPDLASPTFGKDLLDLSNPATYTFLNSIWDEFLPWFDTSSVHIGADEYASGQGDSYRKFINTYDDYLKSKGKTVRVWGSLTAMGGSLPVETDMTVDIWDTSWANPADTDKQGFKIVNANGDLLYIVPKARNYQDYLDIKTLYERWDPSIFDLSRSSMNLNPRDPRLQGAMFCEWNDRLGANISDAEAHERAAPAVPVLGDKIWDGRDPPAQTLSFDDFEHTVKLLGEGLGTHLPHTSAQQANVSQPALGRAAAAFGSPDRGVPGPPDRGGAGRMPASADVLVPAGRSALAVRD
jgi:hexosaminidase